MSSQRSEAEPVSLSQALIITAGMAGLIGLFSGVIIRFSLSNSPNARFLSPLQTFPALSSWTPELPQATADSHYLPGGTSTYQGGRDNPENARPQTLEAAPIPTFETDPESADAWLDETDAVGPNNWDNPADSVDPALVEFFDADETVPDEAYPEQELNDDEYGVDALPPGEPTAAGDGYPDLSDPIGNGAPIEEGYTEGGYEEGYADEAYIDEDYYEPEENYDEAVPADQW